jgi:hypothetical protein
MLNYAIMGLQNRKHITLQLHRHCPVLLQTKEAFEKNLKRVHDLKQ